ncbi:MAG: ROK family protein [Bacteroidetes bacterium]|nr:ROK family protein [Bacteroidota bacterium]MCY4205929.1 ROK family protein [Bacteroidota bacterium]
MALIAGIDIGGTQTRCAIARKGYSQEITYRVSAPTPQEGPDAVLDLVADLVRDGLAPTDRLAAVGCVAPGMTNVQAGVILKAANVNGWIQVPLREKLEKKLEIPAIIENDVNAAVLAEAAVRKFSSNAPFVYMTISTGIAAGIIVGGKIVNGANYCAGEVGWMIPDPELLGRKWQPGGCTERHAGGRGLATQWARIQGGSPDSKRAIEVFDAADRGNEAAQKLIQTASKYLAQTAVGLACVLDPELIVLGGSIGRARPEIIELMRQELTNAVPYPPALDSSLLEDDAPLVGSLLLADSLAGGSLSSTDD